MAEQNDPLSNITYQEEVTQEVDLSELAAELFPEYYTGVTISRGVCFLLALIGVAGNTLAFMTASRLGSHTSGTGFIKCLAVADTAAVVQDGIIELGLPLFGIDLRVISRPVCKGIAWFSWTTTLGGNYVLAVFTLDRLCALYFPIQYRQRSKPWVAVVLSLLVEAAAAAITWPTLLLFDINDEIGSCEIFNFEYFTQAQMVIFANVTIFGFMFFLPFSCILVANLMILAKLKKSTRDKSLSKKEHEITLQLVTVSIAFMLTNFGIVLFIYGTTTMTVETPHQFALRYFLNWVKEFPAIVNNSMNFFLYVLASQHFRTHFVKMIVGERGRAHGSPSSRSRTQNTRV